METPRFLIAQYIPNLRRMETRNIGIILWSPFGLLARFRGELPEQPGVIRDEWLPKFICSKENYKHWIQYWRDCFTEEMLTPATGGRAVSRSSSEFLTALQKSSKASYSLIPGGMVLDSVSEDQMPALLKDLYLSLVAEEIEEKLPQTIVAVAETHGVLQGVPGTSEGSHNGNFAHRMLEGTVAE